MWRVSLKCPIIDSCFLEGEENYRAPWAVIIRGLRHIENIIYNNVRLLRMLEVLFGLAESKRVLEI
jgi:hypothetical protein